MQAQRRRKIKGVSKVLLCKNVHLYVRNKKWSHFQLSMVTYQRRLNDTLSFCIIRRHPCVWIQLNGLTCHSLFISYPNTPYPILRHPMLVSVITNLIRITIVPFWFPGKLRPYVLDYCRLVVSRYGRGRRQVYPLLSPTSFPPTASGRPLLVYGLLISMLCASSRVSSRDDGQR